LTRIAVLDDWQRVARECADWSPLTARAQVDFYETPFANEDDAARRLQPYEVLLVTRERTPFPASLVARLPNLKMFGLTGARAGLIDIAGMIARGITVCYTGGGPSGSSTAEIALGLMVSVARGIPAGDAAVRAGRFQLGTHAGPVLDGKVLGLVGLGRIGARMAAYGHAIGMKVLAWSTNLTDEKAQAAGATRARLLSRAVTGRSSVHAGAERRADAASGVQRDRGLPRVLPARCRKRPRLARRQAHPRPRVGRWPLRPSGGDPMRRRSVLSPDPRLTTWRAHRFETSSRSLAASSAMPRRSITLIWRRSRPVSPRMPCWRAR